jgi:hypothetical protein
VQNPEFKPQSHGKKKKKKKASNAAVLISSMNEGIFNE